MSVLSFVIDDRVMGKGVILYSAESDWPLPAEEEGNGKPANPNPGSSRARNCSLKARLECQLLRLSHRT